MNGETKSFPLTIPQSNVFWDQIKLSNSPRYNIGGYIRMPELDVSRLQRAHKKLFESDEIFRLRVTLSEGDVSQYFSSEVNSELPLLDFSGDGDPRESAESYVEQLFKTPIEYLNESLFKACLIKIAENLHWYVGFAHHLALDGFGFYNWAERICAYYSDPSLEIDASRITSVRQLQKRDETYLSSAGCEKDRDYWSQRCQNNTTSLFILKSQTESRDAVPSCGRRWIRVFDRELFQQVESLADKLLVSVPVVFLGALSRYFASYGSGADINFGLPSHNRVKAADKKALGIFTQINPFVVSLKPDTTVEQHLAHIQTLLKADYRHQKYPLSQRQRECGAFAGRETAFDIAFNFLTYDRSGLTVDGKPCDLTYQGNNDQQIPLSITLWDGGQENLELQFDYQFAFLSEEDVSRISSGLINVLRSYIDNQDVHVRRIDSFSYEEKITLSYSYIAKPKALSLGNTCFHHLFQQQVQQSEQNIALLHDGKRMSYGELNRRANQVARYLLTAGVKADTLVGLCVSRSLDMVVGILGILKAGGAYVPLDPAYPTDRLAYMLLDSSVSLVLTEQSQQSRLAEVLSTEEFQASQAAAVCLDDAALFRDFSTDNLSDVGVTPDNLAYVIYTSGSTGKPKGVMVEHRNISHLLVSLGEQFSVSSQDVLCSLSSFAFDISVFEVFLTLMQGGKTVLVSSEVLLEHSQLKPLLQQCTLIHAVPSLMSEICHLKGQSDDNSWQVRQLFVGGDYVPVALLKRMSECFAEAKITELYGPTECTILSSSHDVDDSTLAFKGAIIGSALANISLQVLDNVHRLLVPVGVAGELYVGGPGVTRGYLNRPELTAERFIANPYYDASVAGSYPRLYRTGDLVRWLENGTLEYLGRCDHQVKLRGYRIELGEIEHALLACDGVKEALVLLSGEAGAERLVGYLVSEQDKASLTERVAREIGSRLPGYMVPTAWVVLESFPLTANGKVDRRSLPEPEMDSAEYVAPQTEMEKVLCEIWQDVLGIEQVGVNDNFFSLGGHSLLVVRMLSLAQSAGLNFSVQDVFAGGTVARLAQRVSNSLVVTRIEVVANGIPAGCEQITPEMVTLARVSEAELSLLGAKVKGGMANIEDIYPLGPLQQGILFHHQLSQDNDPYILSGELKVADEATLLRFVSGLNQLIARHEALRTTVHWQGLSEPLQVVHRHMKLMPEYHRVSGARTPQAYLKTLLDSASSMSLTDGPLMRVQVVSHEDDSSRYVLLQWHHIIADHVALDIIRDELIHIMQGRDTTLPSLPPYRDFISNVLQQSDEAGARDWFSRQLGEVTEPTLPFGLRDVYGHGEQVSEQQQFLALSVSTRIREACRRHQVSTAAFFHSIWAWVLGQSSGRQDVVFGTVLSGRLQGVQGAERMMGVFINTLPLRVSLSGLDGLSVLRQTQEGLSALVSYEQSSLSLAQSCSGISGDVPLFSTLLNYRHSGELTVQTGSAPVQSGIEMLSIRERTNYPLTLSVDDMGTDFSLVLKAQGAAMLAQVSSYLSRATEVLLEALEAETQQSPLLLHSLLSEEEQREALGHHGELTSPQAVCVHTLFEDQVQRQPNATALVCDGVSMSYGELNRRANRVAGYLRSEGVGPDQLVGLCVSRSFEMVVGILGILKAGGAYVPLDPAYPDERLGYLLDDSGVSLVLTEPAQEARLSVWGVSCVCVNDEARFRGFADSNLSVSAMGLAAENLAYVIYTSGSTGKPKGVMVEHQNLVHFNDVFTEQLAACGLKQSNWLWHGSFAFDASFKSILTLCKGDSVILCPLENGMDINQIIGLAIQHKVSVLNMTPSLCAVSLSFINACKERDFHLWLGGEAISETLNEQVMQYTSQRHTTALNLYGPTETTINASYGRLSKNKVTIGKAVPNTSLFILDQNMQLLPNGASGELFIGGLGVARGYLQRPELSGQRFVDNPFYDPATPGSYPRLYRTGDLVRWCDAGTLEYLGRLDNQVKLRGYRIELGEIEHTILSCDSVQDALVRLRVGKDGAEQLVAYLVFYKEKNTLLESLIAQLRERLPEFMVPTAWVELDKFPINPSGKIDYTALPEPEMDSVQYEAPRTETERTLSAIWQEVLGVEQVGRIDNFFALGGHSLLAVRLASRINDAFGVVYPLKAVFSHPTLYQSAEYLAGLRPEQAYHSLNRRPDEAPLRLSFAQQRLWLIDRIGGSSRQYHMSAALRLAGELNVSVLESAFSDIVQRHESLRTQFVVGSDGEPLQVIGDGTDFGVVHEDISALQDDEQNNVLDMLVKGAAAKAFDLSRDLMLRVTLVRLSAQEHVLLVTMHHIASDGWSMGVLIQEFQRLYRSGVDGEDAGLEPLPLQYADYAHWQRSWLQNEVLSTQLSWWGEYLDDLPVVHDLPLDYARPAQQTFEGEVLMSRLPDRLWSRLRTYCQSQGATLFMGLHAAFSVLLSRYSHERDIVVGTPVANREQSEVSGLIGFFANTLVLRSNLEGNPGFASLLAQSRDKLLGCFTRQQVPFEQVVELLQPPRSTSHSPLFQVMLALQNNEQETLSLPGLEILGDSLSRLDIAQFDLTLNVEETDSGLLLGWNYNTALFRPESIARMGQHFEVLLEQMLSQPESDVHGLEMVTGEERRNLLSAFETKWVEHPVFCLHHAVEAQAEQTPDKTALVYEGESLSYGELNRRANQVARYLKSQGVGLETLVGLCVPRSFEMVVGILGILKAGGGYLPMDPQYPSERLTYLLEDSGVSLVLTVSDAPAVLSEAEVTTVDLQSYELFATYDPANLSQAESPAQPDALAYVIYTSGSTGKPKGVMVEHRQVSRLMVSCQGEYGYGESDVWSLFHSFSFDFSVWELWGALLHGGRLVIVPHDVCRSASAFCELLKEQGVTILSQTPGAFYPLAEELCRQGDTGALRYVVFGGEALNVQRLSGWFERYGETGPALVNMYGITETTVHVTHCPVSVTACHDWGAESRIGHALDDLQVLLLNSQGELVPQGHVGEMYVGGAGVTRGYLNREALTAERFVSLSCVEGRFYRTGDLARQKADGELVYVGRCDQQVKFCGYRIELGEIESTIDLLDTVSQSKVFIKNPGNAEAQLIAALVTSQAEYLEKPDKLFHLVADFLKKQLPDYMRPQRFIILDRMPMTLNGKTNINKLQAARSFALNSEYSPPVGETESSLCRIVGELLHIEKVSMLDNFFDLGGHSLFATRLIMTIKTKLAKTLPIKSIFESETLRELARAIDGAKPYHSSSLVAVSRNQQLPLSFSQRSLWLLSKFDSNHSAYNIAYAYKISGHLDYTALQFAFQQILERHEVLRTTYQEDEFGEPYQVIASAMELDIRYVNLTDTVPAEQVELVNRLIKEEAELGFDLTRDLMLRLSILQLSDAENVVMLTVHHIASDGWSNLILIREFIHCYLASVQNQKPELAMLPIQYADFAHWQFKTLSEDNIEHGLSYWNEKLQGLPEVHSLPLDFTRPDVRSFEGNTLITTIQKHTVEKFKDTLNRHGATLFMGLHAVYSVLMSRYSNAEDIVVGTLMANRSQPEVAELIGFFVNVLVLRSDLSGNISFQDMLAQSKTTLLGAYENQHVPFEKVVEKLNPIRSNSYNPMFQVLLVLQNNEVGDLELPGLSFIPCLTQQDDIAKYDLALSVFEEHEELSLHWRFNTSLFKEETISEIAKHFEVLLQAMLEQPDKDVHSLDMLTREELRLRLSLIDSIAEEAKDSDCIHYVFERRVAMHPDELAVRYDDKSISYGELNEKANQLARYLLSKSPQQELVVALCMHHSIEMLVGILAVLKAGGAYVPLDPRYPAERLEMMFNDSGAILLLTQSKASIDLSISEDCTICLDDCALYSGFSGQNLSAREVMVQSDSLAYIVFTSGSTGKPKGVMVEHNAVVQFALGNNYLDARLVNNVLNFSTFAFDGFVFDFCFTLLNGKQLTILSAVEKLDLHEIRAYITKAKVDTFFVTTALFNQLVYADVFEGTGIKNVLFGGENPDPSSIRKALSAWPDVKLVHVYGPTETTVFASAHHFDDFSEPLPIGKNLNNNQLFVLNKCFKPVPFGVVGELYIAGNSLARGYINNEVLTRERFISNDLINATLGVDRIYKTGDLVTQQKDGSFIFAGRVDDQVKIRGYRIELAEIENCLNNLELVKSAFVCAHETQKGDKQLLAYLVADDAAVNEDEFVVRVKDQLAQKLPGYMLPSVFIPLSELPLNINGKVDKSLLPEPDSIVSINNYVAPETQTQQILCGILQNVLCIDKVGVTDDFFELGGQSIFAVKATTQINRVFNLNLGSVLLLNHRTVQQLSEVIDREFDSNGVARINKRFELNYIDEVMEEFEL